MFIMPIDVTRMLNATFLTDPKQNDFTLWFIRLQVSSPGFHLAYIWYGRVSNSVQFHFWISALISKDGLCMGSKLLKMLAIIAMMQPVTTRYIGTTWYMRGSSPTLYASLPLTPIGLHNHNVNTKTVLFNRSLRGAYLIYIVTAVAYIKFKFNYKVNVMQFTLAEEPSVDCIVVVTCGFTETCK